MSYRYDNQPELEGNEILRDRDTRVINATSQIVNTFGKMQERAGVAKPDQFTAAVQQLDQTAGGTNVNAEQALMTQTAEVVNEAAVRIANEGADHLSALRQGIENIQRSSQNNPLFGD